jgi:hypothetical protein
MKRDSRKVVTKPPKPREGEGEVGERVFSPKRSRRFGFSVREMTEKRKVTSSIVNSKESGNVWGKGDLEGKEFGKGLGWGNCWENWEGERYLGEEGSG